MLKRSVIALAFVASALLAPADAAPIEPRGVTPAQVAELLRSANYTANVVQRAPGLVEIETATQTVRWVVRFFNCSDDGLCRDIQFHANFDTDRPVGLEKINAWNASMRFGRAFWISERRVAIEMDAAVAPGASTEQVVDHFSTWNVVLQEYLNALRAN